MAIRELGSKQAAVPWSPYTRYDPFDKQLMAQMTFHLQGIVVLLEHLLL